MAAPKNVPTIHKVRHEADNLTLILLNYQEQLVSQAPQLNCDDRCKFLMSAAPEHIGPVLRNLNQCIQYGWDEKRDTTLQEELVKMETWMDLLTSLMNQNKMEKTSIYDLHLDTRNTEAKFFILRSEYAGWHYHGQVPLGDINPFLIKI